jgi:hypothetical protein
MQLPVQSPVCVSKAACVSKAVCVSKAAGKKNAWECASSEFRNVAPAVFVDLTNMICGCWAGQVDYIHLEIFDQLYGIHIL